MVRLKRIAHRLVCADTDPESERQDPTLSGGPPESDVTESDERNARVTEIFVSSPEIPGKRTRFKVEEQEENEDAEGSE